MSYTYSWFDFFRNSVQKDELYTSNDSNTPAPFLFSYKDETQTIIQGSDVTGGDRFGNSVAISDNYAIVGAHLEDVAGISNVGAAYIFKYDGTDWVQTAKLQPDNEQADSVFGMSVDLDGAFAIVGAHLEGKNSLDEVGAAYIFRRNGVEWSQEAKIQANDGQVKDWFGYSVAIDGEGGRAVVGVHREGDEVGAAYIFRRNGVEWSQEAKIQADGGQVKDWFGYSVAIDGDYIVVGAHEADPVPDVFGGGIAYIFKRIGTTWSQVARIQPNDDDVAVGENFGKSVAISGNYAIVSAHRDNINGDSVGAVYVFNNDDGNWSLFAKVQPDDIQEGDEFGYSVDFANDYLVVGTPKKDTGGNDAGVVYIFRRDGIEWVQEAKIQANDVRGGDEFGRSVALGSEYRVLVGSWLKDTKETNTGGAYVFDFSSE